MQPTYVMPLGMEIAGRELLLDFSIEVARDSVGATLAAR